MNTPAYIRVVRAHAKYVFNPHSNVQHDHGDGGDTRRISTDQSASRSRWIRPIAIPEIKRSALEHPRNPSLPISRIDFNPPVLPRVTSVYRNAAFTRQARVQRRLDSQACATLGTNDDMLHEISTNSRLIELTGDLETPP